MLDILTKEVTKYMKRIADKSLIMYRYIHQRCSIKKGLLKISQNSQEINCAKASVFVFCFNFIEKETLALMFSLGFCGIFKNAYFEEHLRMAASVCISEASLESCQTFTLEIFSQNS